MRLLKLISPFLVIIVLFFCCKKVPEEIYPVVTEVLKGIKVVTNPNYPRDGETRDLLVEELSIGLAEGAEEYMLNRPRDVKTTDDGTICVLDMGDVCIKVYDKNGEYLRTIGQKGQGPGDFGSIFYMVLSSDGRIFVMDPMNRRISEFDIFGKYLGGFRFEGYYSELKIDDMNRIYYKGQTNKTAFDDLPVTEDLLEIETVVQIFRSKVDGEELFLMGDFEGEKNRMKRMATGGVLTTGSEFNIVWEVNKEALLYLGLNQEYKISVFDQDGKKILTFGRKYEPVTQEIGGGENVRKRIMPAYYPIIGWVFDDEGNLWVPIYSENEEEMIYDVFSPQGIYLKQVILPCRIYEIKKGKVYSIVTTEEGFRAVKRFSMKKLNNSPST